MNKKAFTLLELLVVVLIIGILAGIALPQYKMAVLKSRYSTMKNLVKSVVQAQQDYYLINNEYATKFSDLVIDLSCENENNSNHCNINNKFNLYLTSIQTYGILTISTEGQLYFAESYFSQSQYCQANKTNIQPSDFVYKFCQKETGETTPWTSSSGMAAFTYN